MIQFQLLLTKHRRICGSLCSGSPSEFCNFGTELREKRLLAEKDLTYEEALAIAQGSEEAMQAASLQALEGALW